MLPVEILEDIFAYLSRDDLDHCEIICLKWSKVIETSKRLTLRRIVIWNYDYHNSSLYTPFYVELKSSTGKTIRIEPNLRDFPDHFFRNVIIDELGGHSMIEYNPYNENLISPVFKNVIIDELGPENVMGFSVRLSQILEWTGFRIKVKRVFLEMSGYYDYDLESMKRLHEALTEYIDADEIKMEIVYFAKKYYEDEVLFNKESWEYFDFGKKTELNFHYRSVILPDNFSDDIFKEFISGKHMEHSKLNELEIYFDGIEYDAVTSLIVEAFCDTDEPHKFFKSIKTSSYFDEIDSKFGFVREDQEPQKYRMSHPKLKWALEATQSPDEYLKFQLIEL